MIYVRNILLLAISLTFFSGCGFGGQKNTKDVQRNLRKETVKVRKIDLIKSSKYNASLCAVYLNKKSYKSALFKCNKAIKQNSNNAAAYKWKAALHQKLGQYKLAESNYQQAVSLDPTDSGVHNNYGAFLCQQGHYKKSVKEFEQAASNPLYSARAFAYTNAGVCMLRAGNNQKARQYLALVLKLEPNHAQALINMAQLSFDEGRIERANDLMKRWSKSNKQNVRSLWLSIRIAKQKGNINQVSSLGLLLVAHYPQSVEAQKYQRIENY